MVGLKGGRAVLLLSLLLVLARGPLPVRSSALPEGVVSDLQNDEDAKYDGSGKAPLAETDDEENSSSEDAVTTEDAAAADEISFEQPSDNTILLKTKLNRTEELVRTEPPLIDEETNVEELPIEIQARKAASPSPDHSTLLLQASDPADSALTFFGNNSYVKVDLERLAVCPGYEVRLQFRSDLPHGLLAFIRQTGSPRYHQYLSQSNGRLALRTVLGGRRHTFLSDAGGLQDGEWHSATLTVSCSHAPEDADQQLTLALTVDGAQQQFTALAGPAADIPKDGPARLWVGGLPSSAEDSEQPLLHIKKFRGCIKNMQLLQSPAAASAVADGGGDVATSLELVPVPLPLVVDQSSGVESGLACVDKCLKNNPCPASSRCINHFSHVTCDCSGTQTAGPKCSKQDNAVLSLNGDGYLSHKLYDWRDRVEKPSYKLAFHFKTNTSDAVLFFARSLHPSQEFVSLALDSSGRLRMFGTFTDFALNFKVEVDGIVQDNQALQLSQEEGSLGRSEVEDKVGSDVTLGGSPPPLNDRDWHHVVLVYSAAAAAKRTAEGGGAGDASPSAAVSMLHLEPEVYFGYAPDFNQACLHPPSPGDAVCPNGVASKEVFYFDATRGRCMSGQYSGCGGSLNRFDTQADCNSACYIPGLASYKPFIGCMKKLFVEGKNLLEELEISGSISSSSTVYTGQLHGKNDVCHVEESQVLSLTTIRSHVSLAPKSADPQEKLSLKLDFKVKKEANNSDGLLASGVVSMADTLTQWMVYSDGSHLHFKLKNDLLVLTPDSKIRSSAWNTLELELALSQVEVSLNGVTASGTPGLDMRFVSGITLGAPLMALRSCLRNIEVDGRQLYDLRPYLNRDQGVVFDNCQIAGPCSSPSSCLNGGRCSLSATSSISCDCSGTDYQGNRCQFAKYPSSCTGYLRHGFSVSGQYLVDMDGPGPAAPVSVFCRFLEDGSVETELMHSLPDRFVVRRRDLKTHRVSVNYSDLTPSLLQDMVTSSSWCRQNVTFHCTLARLRLSSETWFSSPQSKLITHFGTDIPGVCPCHVSETCVSPDVVCNCDMTDGLRRTDSATFTDSKHLPITGLSLIMDQATTKKNTLADVTISHLLCHNRAPTVDAVSLLDTSSFLELPSSASAGHLTSLGLAFRTSAPSATILYKPAHHPAQADYALVMVSANILEFQYRHKHLTGTLTFHTTYLLNSPGSWQHVWIDFCSEQIRVVLNGLPKFISLEHVEEVLEGDFYIGGTPSDLVGAMYQPPSAPGLIGCLRDLTLNSEAVSLKRLLRGSPTQSFKLGCELSCDPDPCRNGAQCKERPAGDYQCVCGNPYAETGRNCQNNLNANSVTLLNADTEMRLADESSAITAPATGEEDTAAAAVVNPLKHSVTLAFRTREVQGLLLLALDHVQNLLQLHLASPYQVTVIWNTGYTLRNMTIHTKDLALNQGQLVQVYLNRTRSSTELTLLTRGHLLHATQEVGVQLMEEHQYQEQPYGRVVPPHPELALYKQEPILPATPSLKVFLGGASTGGVRSKLPGLVGCLSGFKVGHRAIPLDDSSIWNWNRNTYELGCHSSCGSSSSSASSGGLCMNGGRCMDVFHMGNEQLAQCDCTLTSYRGAQCDAETAYQFSGADELLFRRQYGAELFSNPFVLDFAFAITDSDDEDSSTQALLIVQDIASSPRPLLAVGLKGGQKLSVLAFVPRLRNDKYLAIDTDLNNLNVTDGFRHHLKIAVADNDIIVKINDIKLDTPTSYISLPTAGDHATFHESLIVGGAGDLPQQEGTILGSWTNFKGCISNIQFRTNDAKVYRPLEDYDTNAADSHSFERIGLPNRTTCSKFQPKNLPTVVHNHREYQTVGERAAAEKELPPPARQPFEPLALTGGQENDGSTMKTVGTIAGLLVGAVAFGVFVYTCKISQKSQRTEPTDRAQPQAAYAAVESGQKDDQDSSDSDSDSDSSEEERGAPVGEHVLMMELKTTSSTQETRESSKPTEAVTQPCNLEYVNESPSTGTSSEDKEPETAPTSGSNDEATQADSVQVLQPQVTVTVNPPAASEESSEDQELSEVEPAAALAASNDHQITVDSLEPLDKNELEKSLTKLSESCEDLPIKKDDSSSTSNSGSTASSSASDSDSADNTKSMTDEQKRVSLKKKSSKRKSRRSGSYKVASSDGEEDAAEAQNEVGEERAGTSQEPAPNSDEPKIVSASELEKIAQSDDVLAVDAQKFFLSRKTDESPDLPPRKDKN